MNYMKSGPRVSIVMSVYNGAKYLRESIDSILSQNYKDFEFIIINDASTDATHEVILSYKDPRIVYVKNDSNLGLTTNLNKGLALAKGEFVGRQDDDDVSNSERLEKQVRFLDEHPDIALVGSHVNLIDGQGKVFSAWRMPTEDKDIKRLLERSSAFCHGSVLFRKSAVDDVGGYREKAKYVEDYDLWLRLVDKYKLANIPSPLYSLRRSISSLSVRNLDRQVCNHLFVRALSQERKQTGRDSLDDLTSDNVLDLLNTKYNISQRDVNIYKSQYIKQFYSQAVQTRNINNALKFGWRIFSLNPDLRFLFLMLKQVLQLCLTKAK